MGITSCLLNLGLMITPILMGFLKDRTEEIDFGYHYVTRLSFLMAMISLLVSIIIFWDDLRTTRLLMMNVKERNDFIR